jgi:hypothetical protein
MENMLAVEARYQDQQQQMAWLNEKNWQFARPVKRRPVRQAAAKVLIALANTLAPATRRETQAV